MTRPDFDAVVAGAGHNGLIAACYLARSGMDVLVVEARDTVGGLASTVDALGARVNICMCDHVMIRSTPIIEELDLVAQGLTYVDVDPHHLYLSGDPTAAWFGFHDVEQTAESLAIVHPGAAAGYRRLMDRALPVARLVLDLACEVPTPGASLKALGRHGVSAVSTMLGWARRSALDVLASAGADDVAGMLLAGAPSTWGLPPRHPRTGLAVLSAAVRHAVMPGRPVGGSGALSGSIASRLASVGGKVRCGVSVESVLVESRRVRGVGLSDGSVIEAPVVVCAADPRRLYTEWLAGDPPAWLEAKPPEGFEAKLDVVLDRLPTYLGLDAERHGVTDPLVPTGVVSPGVDGMASAHATMLGGEMATDTVMYANWPSVTDRSLVAEGEHLLGLEVLFTPYGLRGGWDSSAVAERWLERFARVMDPGFLDSVRRWRLVSPVDYESGFGLSRGFVPSFAGGAVSALLGRPRELTRYRASVDGLYVTGGATFPGAGIWGASGRNAASVVLADRA